MIKPYRKSKWIWLISLFVIFGCRRDDVVLEVVQDGCRSFSIDAANFILFEDPCDEGTTLFFEVSFNFNGDSACIDELHIKPTLYDKQNNIMPYTDYESVYRRPRFKIRGERCFFKYRIEFASRQQAEEFNYTIMEFKTLDLTDNESNGLLLRVQTKCTIVRPEDYTVINPDSIIYINRNALTFPIELWDNAAEDGDRVSVYINGEWVIDNFSLLNEKTTFRIPTSVLMAGGNDLVLFALNQGTTGPNTVSISVNGKDGGITSVDEGLTTGSALKLEF